MIESGSEGRRNLAKPAEVAEYMGVTVDHLAQLRHKGRGPRFVRPTGGRAVRYDWRDVEAYIEAQKYTRTDEPAALAAGA